MTMSEQETVPGHRASTAALISSITSNAASPMLIGAVFSV
uniref:Uncharacterized protein n=1 Tax=Arundo donax TaxID=35708 RepID=A0A0A9CMZ1_ARUDO